MELNLDASKAAHAKRVQAFIDCKGSEESSTREIIEWYLEALPNKHTDIEHLKKLSPQDALAQMAMENGLQPGVVYTTQNPLPSELKAKYPEAKNTEQRRVLDYLDNATKTSGE